MQKRAKKSRGSKKEPVSKIAGDGIPEIKVLNKSELAALWIDLAESVPAPVQTKVQVSLLEKLTWENFERLCYRLAIRSGDAAPSGKVHIAVSVQ